MINPTFASIKHQKDIINIKTNIGKRFEHFPTTFKEIRQIRETGKPQIPISSKRLQNQQNTFNNAFNQTIFANTVRKNLVKVEKSGKKPQLYKSPNHKGHEPPAFLAKQKALQQSNYITKLNFTRNQESTNTMTPSLTKTNRSFVNEDTFNNSFLTEKHNNFRDSENGSVSASSKNSFNDSFQLYQQDLSYEQDDRMLREKADFVNSSVELYRENYALNRTINQFGKNQKQIGTMKKSNIYFAKNEGIQSLDRVLCDELQKKSVASSISSMKFSQKFRHYKKHSQAVCPTIKSKQLALSDFKRLREIGEGKYGKVFLAKHIQNGFICALKQVSKKMIREENLQIPFTREMKIQLYLNHPNIVKLYGIFHDQHNVYLIMEYCSDHHLLKLIKQRQHFLQNQRVSILNNIYEAVAFIHCHGIIHRDLKPQNIVIEHGVYKLCDFGWAAYSCGDTRTTFCGTPLYVCPQVLKGQEYNEKADIWGLGVITYELTFGRVPFSILNQSDLLKIIKDPVYFPTWRQAPQKLTTFIRRMLSKKAEERPTLNEILASDVFVNNTAGQFEALNRQIQGLF